MKLVSRLVVTQIFLVRIEASELWSRAVWSARQVHDLEAVGSNPTSTTLWGMWPSKSYKLAGQKSEGLVVRKVQLLHSLLCMPWGCIGFGSEAFNLAYVGSIPIHGTLGAMHDFGRRLSVKQLTHMGSRFESCRSHSTIWGYSSVRSELLALN